MAGDTPTAPELRRGFVLGDWRVFPDENRIEGSLGAKHVEPKLMDLLVCLAEQSGRVVPHEKIFERVWPGAFVADVALKRSMSTLRRLLRDDATRPRYIRTIRKRGYQLIEAVVPLEPHAGAANGDAETDATSRPIRSVAVLPLDDVSGDPEQAFFADGMTDLLISNLARIRALKVISRTSTMRYKGREKPIPVAARELGVDAVVEGAVLRAGNKVRVTARLVDAVRDRLIWAETYERELGDVLRLQSDVARAIVSKIRLELTPHEEEQLARAAEPIDPAVHEACLKGRYFWHKRTAETVKLGLRCFEEALQLDPSYAPAHAGVADSYIVDGGRYLDEPPNVAYGRAREAALRALELDESLAEAHTSLAAVLTDYDWEWSGADREYLRALELNPNYATAQSWYAEHLSRMGRPDEAIAKARRALELDPVSIFSSMLVAWILYFARRYDEAIDQAQATLELDPDYATALRILGWAFEETERYDEAIAVHRRACDLTNRRPNFAAQLGRAYAIAGRTTEARAVLAKLTDSTADSYVSALDLTIIHTALGDHEQAFECLERAFEEHSDHLPYLAVNPRLDALRDDPRLDNLLRRMGLPTRR
jgi:TolB-like protein/tetratricopeptide (TPR) repeat protein